MFLYHQNYAYAVIAVSLVPVALHLRVASSARRFQISALNPSTRKMECNQAITAITDDQEPSGCCCYRPDDEVDQSDRLRERRPQIHAERIQIGAGPAQSRMDDVGSAQQV